MNDLEEDICPIFLIFKICREWTFLVVNLEGYVVCFQKKYRIDVRIYIPISK